MKALRFIWWILVFLCLYTTLIILFQYGPTRFSEGMKEQVTEIQKLFIQKK